MRIPKNMYYYIWTIVHCTLHRFDKKNYLGCKNEHTIWFKTQRPIFHITQVRLLIYLLGGADQEALLKPVRLVRGKFLWTVIPLEQTFYLHHTKYKFSITSVLFITHLYKTLSTGKLVLWNTKKPGTSWWVRLRFICVWMLKQLIIPSVKQSQFSPLVFEGLLQHHLLAWAFFSWHNFCDTRHKKSESKNSTP